MFKLSNLKKMFIVFLCIMSLMTTNVLAYNYKNNTFTCKTMTTKGNVLKNRTKKSYKKIVKSYEQLEKLKKYVKNNYNSPDKYLKQLKKYNKKFFKKNTLIFVTECNDVNAKKYKISSIEKKNNKVYVNIDCKIENVNGKKTIASIIYGTNTYLIKAKKSNVKDVKKIKVIYKDKK